jgi:hypothetical protein
MHINNLFMKVAVNDHFGSCACMGGGGYVIIICLKRICGEDVIWVQLAQARISMSGMER